MARVSSIEADQASPEVKEIYEQTLKGKPGSVQKLMAHRPQMLKSFLPFYASVGRSLDRKLYELIYIRVSMINECQYCLQHHLAASKRAGVTPDDWAALKTGDYSRFTPKEAEALAFADKVTRSPQSVGDGDFAGLKKHFNDAEIVDLHMLAGLVNLTNRVTGPLDAELEFPAEKI
jgi:uncharacterized peroxidase-related enzyme